jgi:hypothetical protein
VPVDEAIATVVMALAASREAGQPPEHEAGQPPPDASLN